jgi:hypothetical protein
MKEQQAVFQESVGTSHSQPRVMVGWDLGASTQLGRTKYIMSLYHYRAEYLLAEAFLSSLCLASIPDYMMNLLVSIISSSLLKYPVKGIIQATDAG